MNMPSSLSNWTPLGPQSDGAGPSTARRLQPETLTAYNGPATAAIKPKSEPPWHNRRRMPAGTYEILNAFFYHTSKYPTLQEKHALLARIQGIKDCEEYTVQRLSRWFSTKRQQYKDLAGVALTPPPSSPKKKTKKGRQVAASPPLDHNVTSAKILYPSLLNAPNVLHMLEVLLLDNPTPSPAVTAIWAERLGHGVLRHDVETYVRLRNAQRGHDQRSPINTSTSAAPSMTLLPFRRDSPSTQLPTPSTSTTTSPEPSSASTSPVTSPLIGSSFVHGSKLKPPEPTPEPGPESENEDEEDEDELMSMSEDEDEEAEMTPIRVSGTMVSHANLVNRFPRDCTRDLVFKLSKGLDEAENPRGTPPSPPKDFASMNMWLQQRNQTCSAFLDNVARGKYASIGLVDHTAHSSMQ